MSESTSPKNAFKFTIPLAITLLILAFFILFRGAISQLISGGDCLDMEFFGSKINTCQVIETKDALLSEQEEISTFVKSLKSTIDSLENESYSLKSKVVQLESEIANDGNSGVMQLSSDDVLSDKQQRLYSKYTTPSEPNTKE